MIALFLSTIATTLAAFASPVQLSNVGSFGGLRLWIPCELNAQASACMLDTGSRLSATAIDVFAGTTPLRSSGVVGVGGSSACSVYRLQSFEIAHESPSPPEIRFCPSVGISNSPLIGTDALPPKSMTFDFVKGDLTWGLKAPANARDLYFDGDWYFVPLTIGGIQSYAMLDTGTPVTMIDRDLVAKNPSVFVKSAKPITPELAKMGMVAYDLKSDVTIDGLTLGAGSIYSYDSNSMSRLPVILGLNHFAKAKWYLDLPNKKWLAVKP